MSEFYSIRFNNSRIGLKVEADNLDQAKGVANRQGALRGATSYTIGQFGDEPETVTI